MSGGEEREERGVYINLERASVPPFQDVGCLLWGSHGLGIARS